MKFITHADTHCYSLHINIHFIFAYFYITGFTKLNDVYWKCSKSVFIKLFYNYQWPSRSTNLFWILYRLGKSSRSHVKTLSKVAYFEVT